MRAQTYLFVTLLSATTATTAMAQTPAPAGQQPERRVASVNTEPRVDVTNMARPIDMHDSVWIEDLTMLEVRDLIKGGKTTALILTGGIEENGPYLTTGKHNNVLKATGESIARALGNALVAPIVTLEPGNPMRPNLSPGTVVLSQATFQAVLTDMATSLKGMGFTTVILMGDSGGNQGAMKAVAEALTAKYPDPPQRFIFIPEYYDYASAQKMIQSSGIPEQITIGASQGSDGLHEELAIDALMAQYDPETIRLDQRTKAKRATINGVDLLPLNKTLELAKKIVELRTKLTVDAIAKALAPK